MFPRALQPFIVNTLFKGKALVIYGARQVGKTTLAAGILKEFYKSESLVLNCDEAAVRLMLSDAGVQKLRGVLGNTRLVLIDEAQRVENIGLALKIMVDQFPGLQVIATGSSSLDLSNRVKEPLTGRIFSFRLFPLSIAELARVWDRVLLATSLERLLIYGSYPDVINQPALADRILLEMSSSYLYKDILEHLDLRRPQFFEKLLRLLALQTGSEVSYNELAGQMEISRQTVETYIELLENCFVVFRLFPYHNNKRKELTRKCKVYFYDNGIRNALLRNFNPLELREDTGRLFENYLVSEMAKHIAVFSPLARMYFWRTLQGDEVDLLVEENGKLQAFEFKYSGKGKGVSKAFHSLYPEAECRVIDRNNWFNGYIPGKAVE